MSLRTRIIGFGTSVLLGIFFGFVSYAALSSANPGMFAVFYSLTNIIFISGTGFIVGPMKQFKLMFTPERVMSSLIYIAATVAVILTRKKLILCAVLFFVQVLSLVWYTLSYIPYAQEVITKMIGV